MRDDSFELFEPNKERHLKFIGHSLRFRISVHGSDVSGSATSPKCQDQQGENRRARCGRRISVSGPVTFVPRSYQNREPDACTEVNQVKVKWDALGISLTHHFGKISKGFDREPKHSDSKDRYPMRLLSRSFFPASPGFRYATCLSVPPAEPLSITYAPVITLVPKMVWARTVSIALEIVIEVQYKGSNLTGICRT